MFTFWLHWPPCCSLIKQKYFFNFHCSLEWREDWGSPLGHLGLSQGEGRLMSSVFCLQTKKTPPHSSYKWPLPPVPGTSLDAGGVEAPSSPLCSPSSLCPPPGAPCSGSAQNLASCFSRFSAETSSLEPLTKVLNFQRALETSGGSY